ncbi:ATP-binding cassette sub-family C member 4-like [Schistocerca cancellata]|uniref:ATP-binding cassette sub-family C member 4-like n=1 Tax=Schistocerca cancellata TaxID=274614 RepID=UPI002118BEE7|nr:ATP-binding cassette sub-family C member 4-like [Schistocerca cancellata]
MDSKTYRSEPNPRLTANPVSRLYMCWLRPLIWKSFRKGITEDDLYDTLEEDITGTLGDELERNWEKQLEKSKTRDRKPSLMKALVVTFWKSVTFCAFLSFAEFVVLRSTQPLLVGRVVKVFSPGARPPVAEEYGFAAALVANVLVRIFCWHHNSKEAQLVGMRVRVACCSLIYRKVLRLSRQTPSEGGMTPTGGVVNLMTNDVSRFDKVVLWGHCVWCIALQLPLIVYLLYTQVEYAAFAGAAFILIITLPSQHMTARLSAKFRMATAGLTDERMKMMNEVVMGIRVIKMYAWEKPFAKLVALARRAEVSKVTKTAYLRSFVLALEFFVDRTALFVTLLTCWLLNFEITADKVFVITQLLYQLNMTMGIAAPLAVSYMGEAIVSVRRIQEFLLKPEVREVGQDEKTARGEATLHSATASWDGSYNALQGVSIRAQPGQLCAVVGPVGSGKSSVLQALLGELQTSEGHVSVGGRVAYASQEPWVFAGTVRNNILLGRPYQHEWYRKVVRACALERDFQLLPRGDHTVVGQKGATLSGGQRARINLARAVYGDADIYLLDDPLSAVDTHVGRQLFKQCVCSLLANKTRILVTHQIQYLHAANKIVVMDEGKIEDQGTFTELAKRSTTFFNLMSTAEDGLKEGDVAAEKEKESEKASQEKAARRASRQSVSSQHRLSDASRITANGELSAPDVDDEDAEVVDTRALGKVMFGYARAGGGPITLFFVFFTLIGAQVVLSLCDYWVSFWTAAEEARKAQTPELPAEDGEFFVSVYGGLVALLIASCIGRSLIFFRTCMRASRRLHNWMFERVLRAPMRFFDSNPSGRILNRFSKDIGAVDELLPFPTLDMLDIFLYVFAIIIVVATVQYLVLIPLALLASLFIWLAVMFITTGRNVKRMEGIRRSPVFSHLSDTINGLTTVRSSRIQEVVKREFDAHQDRHTSAWFLYVYGGTALGLWLDMISVSYVAVVTFSFIIFNPGSKGSSVGLAITQSLFVTDMLQYGILQLNESVSQATSVERVLEYTRLDMEPALESEPGKKPPKGWPSSGAVVFQDVTLRYGADVPPVLKAVNFSIAPTHKVGIVGRTGAGKSSLISALFRLAPIEGAVLLDDIDTQTIGLHDLRRHISIIPQEPVLFSASMRFNLDPFQEFDDAKLWEALEEVELKHAVDSLDSQVTEGGGNLSVGQRQLVCLARAILRNNKVLVLDEATANVDTETDALIQQTIRRKFHDCTVLTIAHRLNTIMDSDRILVMDAGQVAEYGTPHELLMWPEGFLTAMVKQTGPAMEKQLRAMAEEAFRKTESPEEDSDTEEQEEVVEEKK